MAARITAVPFAIGCHRLRTVEHKCAKHTRLQLEAVQLCRRSKGSIHAVARGIGKIAQCGIKSVPLIIDRQIGIPHITDNGIVVCRRHIKLLLPEFVVDIHQRSVGIEVAHIVVGILGIQLKAVTLAHVTLQLSLYEEIAVPLPLRVLPHIVHNRPGDSLVGVIEICLQIPLAVVEAAKQPGFHAQRVYVAVLSCCSGVPCKCAVGEHLAIAELVLSGGIDIFCAYVGTHAVTEPLLHKQRRIGKSKRPGAHRHLHIRQLSFGKMGLTGAQIDSACCAKVFRRLEYVALLPVVHRNLLDIVEREFSKVDLPVLGIAELQSVVEHTHMVGAHTANVDRLDAAHTAIVLDLCPRKVTNCIGYRQGIKRLQFLAPKALSRNHRVARRGAALHNNLVEILHTVEPRCHPALGSSFSGRRHSISVGCNGSHEYRYENPK